MPLSIGKYVFFSGRFDGGRKEKKLREICEHVRRADWQCYAVNAGVGESFGTATERGLYEMHTMVAVAFDGYGERTKAVHCTYYEVRYAHSHHKQIIPLRFSESWPPSPGGATEDDRLDAEAQLSMVFDPTMRIIDARKLSSEQCAREICVRLSELRSRGLIRVTGASKPQDGGIVGRMRKLMAFRPAVQEAQEEPTFFAITASADSTAQMWSMRSGKLLRTFRGHTNALWSCILSPDNTRLFTTSQDGTAKMWDVSTGTCLRTYKGQQGQPNWACVTPDMQYLVTAVNDQTAKVFRVDSGKLVKCLPHKGCVCSVVAAKDGKHVFSADDGGFGRKFSVPDFEQVCVFDGKNERGLYSCCLSGDGTRFFTASHDGSVKMFDAQRGGDALLSFEGPGKTSNVMAPPKAPLVFCGRDDQGDGAVQMFSTETGDLQRSFRGHGRGVSAIWVSPDERWLLTASWDKTAKVWDMATGDVVLTYRGHSSLVQGIVCGGPCQEQQAQEEPNFFAVTASADGTAQMWSMRSGKLLRTFQGHTYALWSCILSPDNTRLFTTSQDGTAKMWDVSTGNCLRTYEGRGGQPNWACVTPDMQYLVTAVNDETAKVFRVDSGKLVKCLPHKGCVCSVVAAKDGKHVFTADDGGFGRKFSVPDFEQVCVFDGKNERGLYSCCLSGDGTHFFTASHDGSVKMFDATRGGDALLSFEGPGKTSNVMAPPKASLVFCGRDDQGDGAVQMFSTETGDLKRSFRGHGRGVSAIWVSPDEKWLLTASWDKTAKVWDIATGEAVLTYRGHSSLVQGIVCGGPCNE